MDNPERRRQPTTNLARRKGPKRRDETEAERQRLRDEAQREINQLAAEFHAKLTREDADMIGSAYARYSSRHQQSIADQIRTIFEAALRLRIFIPVENVFFDQAVRGYKEQREGLNALRAFLNSGKRVNVFLVFSTNRLYRKNCKSLQFVEEIVARGIRNIFVKSGVDSADEKRWRMLLQMNSMMDEFVVSMYSENIRAAHEGLFDKGLVCITLPFGYTGELIPGENTKTGKPRRRLVINSNTAS